jgi:hypothetical protein
MPKIQTPWGPPDTVIRLDPDDMILRVHTCSHGGIGVHPLQSIPPHIAACAQVDSEGWRWFEEDVAAAAVILAFPHLFGQSTLAAAKDSLRNNLPATYTEHFGEVLTAANSRAIAQREFEASTRDNFIVTAGFGSSFWNVPCGYVYLTVNSPSTTATTIWPLRGLMARSTTTTSPSPIPASIIDRPRTRIR